MVLGSSAKRIAEEDLGLSETVCCVSRGGGVGCGDDVCVVGIGVVLLDVLGVGGVSGIGDGLGVVGVGVIGCCGVDVAGGGGNGVGGVNECSFGGSVPACLRVQEVPCVRRI